MLDVDVVCSFNVICICSSTFLCAVNLFWLAEVVVSPPFVFLPLVKSLLRSDFHVAAQNCWVRKGGAFTGEVRSDLPYHLYVKIVLCMHCFSKICLYY